MAAYEALRAAFSKWLNQQAHDVIRLAERILGVRTGDALARLVEEINEYYKSLAGVMPADQKAAIEEIARAAMKRVAASVGEGSGVTEAWLASYLGRYYNDANERLCRASQKQIERYIANSEGDVVSSLRSKLAKWSKTSAEVMARHETAMALNKTLVAGFYRAGYSAIWRSAPGCCKACVALNGQTVTTLTPPLHKGCACTVDKGEKTRDLPSDEVYAKMASYLESAGVGGTLNIPARQISGIEDFHFDAAHIARHSVPEEDARAFIAEARLSLTRSHHNGEVYECFFGERGATYVRLSDQVIRTSFFAEDYDPRIRALIREMIRLGV